MKPSGRFTGTFLLLNKEQKYGFIAHPNYPENIYCNFRHIPVDQLKQLWIFDSVDFSVGISQDPVHAGTPTADQLEFPFTTFLEKFGGQERWIAQVVKWDGRTGLLETPSLDKHIFIKFNILAYCDRKTLQRGDLLVVGAVKSGNARHEHFARFAYPLQFEQDSEFLAQQFATAFFNETHWWPLIEKNWNTPIPNTALWKAFYDQLTETKESKIPKLEKSLSKLKAIEFQPSLQQLTTLCTRSELLNLWLNGHTSHYDFNYIRSIFLTQTDQSGRKQILDSLQEVDEREILLKDFLEPLTERPLLEKDISEIRNLLDLVIAVKLPTENEIAKKIKILIASLPPRHQVDLWLAGLVVELKDDFLLQHLELDDPIFLKSLSSGTKKRFSTLVDKIFAQLKYEITENNFEEHYVKLIPFLLVLIQKYKETCERFLNWLNGIVNEHQKFILWVFEVPISFDGPTYFHRNYKNLPVSLVVRFFNHSTQTRKAVSEEAQALLHAYGLSQSLLESFVQTIPWTKLQAPCRIKDPNERQVPFGFLEEMEYIVHAFDIRDILVRGSDSVAESLYRSWRPLNGFHARLWMNNFVPRYFYDYYGFRQPFRELTRSEKKVFRSPSDEAYVKLVEDLRTSEVTPCQIFVDYGHFRVYQVTLQNLYFGINHLKLRQENGRFTGEFKQNGLTRDWNYLPLTGPLGKIEMEVTVVENSIKKVVGIEKLFSLIQPQSKSITIYDIELPDSGEEEEPSYTDDLVLQERILDHLKRHQVAEYEIQLLRPQQLKVRVDKKSVIKVAPLCALFTLESPNDYYTIIWEFLDLSAENATYVFKCKKERFETTLARLKEAIISFCGLRSLLSGRAKPKVEVAATLMADLRQGLGYIQNFKIIRGDREAFGEWVHKLNESLVAPAPEYSEGFNFEALLEIDTKITIKVKPPPREGVGGKIKVATQSQQKIIDINSPPPPLPPSPPSLEKTLMKMNSLLDKLISTYGE